MRRREFIWGTAALGLAGPSRAQTDARYRRVAIVHPSAKPEMLTIDGARAYKAYFQELIRRGHVEGQNLIIERFTALGRSSDYENLTRAAVDSKPDVIVCFGTPLALRLKALTTTVPIVATSADPIATGLVNNLGRPLGNITGVSVDAGIELWGKRFQLLREVVRSDLKNVRFLFTNTTILWKASAASVEEAAERAGIKVSPAMLGETLDQAAYERVFGEMERDRVDGLIVYDATEHLTNRSLIVDLASRHHLPAIYPFREFPEVGGLFSYGVDSVHLLRQLAAMTDQILKGAAPGDIPFAQQTKFELVLNQVTAKSLRLEFPASLLAVADEVIE